MRDDELAVEADREEALASHRVCAAAAAELLNDLYEEVLRLTTERNEACAEVERLREVIAVLMKERDEVVPFVRRDEQGQVKRDEACFDDPLLDPVTPPAVVVDATLQAQGLDPDALAKRGVAEVERLLRTGAATLLAGVCEHMRVDPSGNPLCCAQDEVKRLQAALAGYDQRLVYQHNEYRIEIARLQEQLDRGAEEYCRLLAATGLSSRRGAGNATD